MEGGTKGEGKKKTTTSQLLAFGLTSLGIKLQNSDDTGGRNEKHLSLGHHSRKRIAFLPPPQSPFFYTTVLDQGKGEGGGSYANAWQSFMASRNVVAGCISLTLAKKKKHLFKTFLSQEGADKRAAILVRKARMLYKKKPT